MAAACHRSEYHRYETYLSRRVRQPASGRRCHHQRIAWSKTASMPLYRAPSCPRPSSAAKAKIAPTGQNWKSGRTLLLTPNRFLRQELSRLFEHASAIHHTRCEITFIPKPVTVTTSRLRCVRQATSPNLPLDQNRSQHGFRGLRLLRTENSSIPYDVRTPATTPIAHNPILTSTNPSS